MNESEERPVVTEADITPRSIERRTFLGRFGVAVGLAGMVGLTQACGGGEASDSDGAAASDSDSSDADAAETPSPDSTAAPTSDADSGSDSS